MQTAKTISKVFVQKLFKSIPADAHKGTQGHVLLVGGSYGKIGSICLSSKAALKSGCGLLTAFLPHCGYPIIQTILPEAMVITDENFEIITNIQYDFHPNAIGIGVGIGQNKATQLAVYQFLKNNKSPLIVDADALNILAINTDWLSLLPSKTIITPHKKELERLIGSWSNEEEKWLKTVEFSLKNDLIIVVKGAPTFIVDGTAIFQNTTGNQALATAGSGDVLTGIITSLVAQNYSSIEAAILGVYLHGLTADIALPDKGFHSFIASDIIDYLPKAFLSL